MHTSKARKMRAGFYAAKTHNIVACHSCALQPEIFSEIVGFVCDFADKNGMTAYDELTGKGLLRHIYLRRGDKTGEIMVCLVVNGNNIPNENAFANEIVAEGGIAKAYSCNVLNKEICMGVAQQVMTDLGPCDILVNGAGGNNPKASTDKEYFEIGDIEGDTKSFFDLDAGGVGFVFNLNFLGTLIPTQVFARDMAEKENTCIVMVTSMNAYRPLTKIPAYSAAKAAVKNFTEFMAVHFADVGIRVNAIAPGFFSTKQNAALLWNADGTPTARTGKILAATPMGRFGKPEELLGALLFLVDEKAASFVTGIVIPVDGGFSAYSGV